MVGGLAAHPETCPAPDTAWWGGAADLKFASVIQPFHATENNCCDTVATRAVSSDQQLKSLRNERWRRPLSHRNCRRWTDRPGLLAKIGQKGVARPGPEGSRNRPPGRACKILFGNLAVQILLLVPADRPVRQPESTHSSRSRIGRGTGGERRIAGVGATARLRQSGGRLALLKGKRSIQRLAHPIAAQSAQSAQRGLSW